MKYLYATLFALTLVNAQAPPDTTADVVYGQAGDFTTASTPDPIGSPTSLSGPSAIAFDVNNNMYVADTVHNRVKFYPAGSFAATRVYSGSYNLPRGVALDSNGNLYVADTDNSRILYYAAGSTSPTRVYGQAGSFSGTSANNGGVSANSLSSPTRIALDGNGNLYVADQGNHRVLMYLAGSTTATRVYGQGGIFTTRLVNNGGRSADSLSSPQDVAVDAAGNVYIADTNNSRVLVYTSGSTTATRVYGQADFATAVVNTLTATSLRLPQGVRLDSAGNVYITDTGNTRLLVYPASGSTTATAVYGQPGFTTRTAATTADGLSGPSYTAVDSSGNLYVADTTNNRVLKYVPPSATATAVWGQGGSFTTSVTDQGGRQSANTLNSPRGVLADGNGNLYVADTTNNRVLYYPAGSTTATRVYGQAGSFETNLQNKNAATANTLNGPTSLALDASGNLYIADFLNSRVLFYPSGSTTATRVYGQGNNLNSSGFLAMSVGSLLNPYGIALDGGGNLYVADTNGNRVLFYPAGSTTPTRVYGQAGSFTTSTTNNGGISANSIWTPQGLTVDSNGNLYVADSANHRVLFYPAGSTTATRVYGQAGSFSTNTSNNGGISANSLNNPGAIALDSNGNLYVTDGNHRVLYYPAGSTTATQVYGQGGSFTTQTSNNGGRSANSLSLVNSPGLSVDGVGNLYVADSGNNRVLKFNKGTYTVNTSPAGLSFTVDGTPYTTAQTVYQPGPSRTIATTTPQAGTPGTRYVFANWSDGGALSHAPNVPSGATVTANFQTEYLLTTSATGLGTVTPPTGYQNAGPVNLTATPSSACAVFSHWLGGAVSGGQVTLASPLTLTGVFTPSSGAAIKGSMQTVRTTPVRFRQAVSAQNTLSVAADVTIIVDGVGAGVNVVAPASPTGTTTACTGTAGRAYYTVPNVAPGAYGSVTFDFTAPNAAAVSYTPTAVIGAGPR